MWRFLDFVSRALRARWQRWVQNRHPRGQRTVTLKRDRIYIFLSSNGFTFTMVLLAMLAGAINYELALAYALVFLLAAMAVVSIFHTFRNLLGMQITPGRIENCFVGENARFEVVLHNPDRLPRQHVNLAFQRALSLRGRRFPFSYRLGRRSKPVRFETSAARDIPPGGYYRTWLSQGTTERGWLRAPRIRLETHWPLGVFVAWSYVQFAQRALVYPAPEVDAPPLPEAGEQNGSGIAVTRGRDDFAGLRPFQRGDSPRHISWKAAARRDDLPVKTFHGEAARALSLCWDDLPPTMAVEIRLSRLTAWILQARARELAIGIVMPGCELAPANSEAHYESCLSTLALFGLRETDADEAAP